MHNAHRNSVSVFLCSAALAMRLIANACGAAIDTIPPLEPAGIIGRSPAATSQLELP